VKLILSRKGFDSSSGGGPSPILPDGRMVSLPIPDDRSGIRYGDIERDGVNIGKLASDLTLGGTASTDRAHLDPDLHPGSLSRSVGWRPVFGQTGAAQGHLDRNGVQEGDVFLFYGLFRRVCRVDGVLKWAKRARKAHVIWGWLQVDRMVRVDACGTTELRWGRYHPHFHREPDSRNTLYVSGRNLSLGGPGVSRIRGAGLFERFDQALQLTAVSGRLTCDWALPEWFYPARGRAPLTYHGDLDRWERSCGEARLRAVSRGQEFVLDCEKYPEAIGWVTELMMVGRGTRS